MQSVSARLLTVVWWFFCLVVVLFYLLGLHRVIFVEGGGGRTNEDMKMTEEILKDENFVIGAVKNTHAEEMIRVRNHVN